VLFHPDKGKFSLGYPAIAYDFPREINLKDKYDKFENMNPSQDFRLLFKRQIVDELFLYQRDERFPKLVENIESVIQGTENNYEVFLKRFDFEKLKKDFRKERDEYFERVRGIVDRLLGKVVSIPISISAAAITIYNLKDEPNHLIITLIMVAFVTYSIFTSFLLRLLHVDTFEIKQDFENDLEAIEKFSNIPKPHLEKESSKVYRKIRILNNTLLVLQLLLCGSSIAVLSVAFLFFTLEIKYVCLIIAIVSVLQLFVSFWRISLQKNAEN
jgi:hypothetical protein